jgi:hypothetical protein
MSILCYLLSVSESSKGRRYLGATGGVEVNNLAIALYFGTLRVTGAIVALLRRAVGVTGKTKRGMVRVLPDGHRARVLAAPQGVCVCAKIFSRIGQIEHR